LKNDFDSSSRSNYRAKRKKTNFILNGLIVIVLLLIAFVAYSIFSSGNDKTSTKKNVQKIESKQSLHKDKTNKKDQEAVSSDSEGSNGSDETSQSGDSSTSDSSKGSTDESQAASTEDGTQTTQTIENPDWKPAGTTQTGEHSANYDSSSTDWQEMLNAISSATGLDQSNMTVWFLGRDKSTSNGSVGTVSSKDKQQKYRVYIQWVDGQGWKPTKVEKLSEISNGN
jgi:FtsZ-interacting cell division protein ZipA